MTLIEKQNLHIILYSRLEKYGGGRETWASYFLRQIHSYNEFNQIYIYYINSNDEINTIIPMFKEFNNIVFHGINIYKKKPVINNIIYIKAVISKIGEYSKDGDFIVALGTIAEGLSAIGSKVFLKQKLKYLYWIRSIGLKEISTQKNVIIAYLFLPIEMLLFKMSNAIIYNGLDTHTYYKKNYPQHIRKMHVLENAVDNERYNSIENISYDHNTVNITYIGRFNKEKGFFDFLKSIKTFNSKYNNLGTPVKFHIWGHGMDFVVPENTIYHGTLKKDKEFEALNLSHVIVFLNLSKSQLAGGLSHSLLEALAAGRICLAYSNPAHNQILNENNSILVNEGDINSLAQNFAQIAEKMHHGKIDELKEITSNARFSTQKFSVKNHVEKFLKIKNTI